MKAESMKICGFHPSAFILVFLRASHLNLFDQPGVSCIALLVQLETPRGRIARLEFH